MRNKVVKIRKERQCEWCGKNHDVGEMMQFESLRHGRFDAEDNQIGIGFYRGYYCHVEHDCYDRQEGVIYGK